jgi:hypothetical protein
MTTIVLKTTPHYIKAGAIYASEKDTMFDSEYEVVSNVTGAVKLFTFDYATGSEFDPKTEWVYKSVEGYELHICNDTETTRNNVEAYLKAKLRK